MTTSKTNRTNQQGKDQQVIQGIQKDLQQMSSLPLGGATFTPTTLTAFVQSRIDAANEVATAKANWQNAAKTYLALNKQANVVIHDLKQLVIGAFGAASPKLADFGFTPRKKAVLTPEQKAAAAKKRAATRTARGTKGPKAKLSIKGTVPATGPATGTTTPAGTAVTQAQTATAPAAAPPDKVAPPAAATPATAPAQAPTVTVNVTTAPAATPVAATATTGANPPAQGQPQPQQTQAPTAAPAATTGTAAKS
jgi:hypothetical protein